MKKILLPLLAFVLCTATTVCSYSGLELGKPVTLKQVTKISEIEKNPEAFVGKKVLVSGTVVEVCSSRGCWMNIASDTPFEKIQIKVVDGVIVFPMSARGQNAYVEGVVEKLSLSKNEAIDYYRHKAEEKGQKFDPATVTGAETIYRIRALGAVIEH
ncbi:MAG: DUF4920 domain-containing protein [Proteobacteria bacterium]|nr:DUF4920 domain-containing protein [Pseudomonadota bacterium]MBU1738661.1 DUF4920 domain-containing protein [Pseudomonadota bacterium]